MSPTVRVLMVGPPASGKGTQGRLIAEHYGVPYLSSGEMLRAEVEAGTELGRRVAGLVHAGDLVPDDVMLDLFRDRFTAAVRSGGCVLDGFPRTLAQARAAHDIASTVGAAATAVIFLDVPDEELARRMRHRAVAENRADDTDSVLRHRIAVYREQTAPLLDYYGERGVLVRIDAARPLPEVTADVLAAIEERGAPAAAFTASSSDPSTGAGASAEQPVASD